MRRILVINPGSTSTKAAVYEDMRCVVSKSIKIDQAVTAATDQIVEQLDLRTRQIADFIADNGLKAADFDIITARGGMLPPCKGGAYRANKLMADVLRNTSKGQHASNLGCMIGLRLGEGLEVPVIIYDPLTVDEMDEVAKMTGLPEITIEPVTHVLNSRKVCRDVAARQGIDYRDGNFIVAHLGGGVSITAHERGRLADFLSTSTGPMSPERAGGLPTSPLVDMCFSGKYTQREIMKRLIGKGGFIAWLGTSDALEASKRAQAGDALAAKVFAAMSYQIAKAIGDLYAALSCKVDAIIFTGAMAHSKLLLDPVIARIGPMAPIEILAGEREMDALAEGGLRVLNGLDVAREYDILPEGFGTVEEFYAKFGE